MAPRTLIHADNPFIRKVWGVDSKRVPRFWGLNGKRLYPLDIYQHVYTSSVGVFLECGHWNDFSMEAFIAGERDFYCTDCVLGVILQDMSDEQFWEMIRRSNAEKQEPEASAPRAEGKVEHRKDSKRKATL